MYDVPMYLSKNPKLHAWIMRSLPIQKKKKNSKYPSGFSLDVGHEHLQLTLCLANVSTFCFQWFGECFHCLRCYLQMKTVVCGAFLTTQPVTGAFLLRGERGRSS